MREPRVVIPDDVELAKLCLSRGVEGGRVRFSRLPLAVICKISGQALDEIVDGTQPLVVLSSMAWYQAHRSKGRSPDPVQEDLLAEARLEMERGGGRLSISAGTGLISAWPAAMQGVRQRPSAGRKF